jgi:tripartite-type tricarboxylate transporter receptor subunit TctC
MTVGSDTIGSIINKETVMISLARLVRFAALAATILASMAQAQNAFPQKPVRIIVPAAPGGTTDLLARAVASKLTTKWGQPVLVDNRPGAGQIIGAEAVAKAAPDGYTLLVSDSSTFVINPHLYGKLPYQTLRDFTPITTIANASPVIAVAANVDARNLKEFLALAKTKPGALSYGSMGTGSYAHIASEQISRIGGVKILHVPYKGFSPVVQDLAAGTISMALGNVSGFDSYHKAGRLRIIATATPQRLQQYPDIPTAAESGLPNFEASTWFGVVGPARMEPTTIAKINGDILDVVHSPDFQTILTANGLEMRTQSPDQFGELIKADLARWKPLVAASGATLD